MISLKQLLVLIIQRQTSYNIRNTLQIVGFGELRKIKKEVTPTNYLDLETLEKRWNVKAKGILIEKNSRSQSRKNIVTDEILGDKSSRLSKSLLLKGGHGGCLRFSCEVDKKDWIYFPSKNKSTFVRILPIVETNKQNKNTFICVSSEII